jgi:putative ABC transport system permease protein
VSLLALVWKNTWARRGRVLLTLFGVAVAVAAFGFLRTTVRAYHAGVDAAASDRLVVRNRASLAVRMPIAHGARIAAVPGVTRVAAADWFGGVYKDEKHFFASLAVDAEPFLALFPEYLLDDDERAAFLADPAGAVVGEKLAQLYGWQRGSRVTLRGTMFPGDFAFTVRGVYRPRDPATLPAMFLFHWRYLDEQAPEERKGETLAFFAGVADPARSAEVAHAIDERFRGAEVETLSESEKSFHLTFISMASMVLVLLRGVAAFMLLVVVLVLGGAIGTAVRERTGELAVMKALGFSRRTLVFLVAAEAGLLGLLGGLAGSGLALVATRLFARFMDRNLGAFFPIFALEPRTVAYMIGGALGLAVLAALVPVGRVLGLRVADALRRVD